MKVLRTLQGAMLLLGTVGVRAYCQVAPTQVETTAKEETPALLDEIRRQDTAMFEAFNRHDLDATMSMFSEKLEFFHDTGGLQSYSDVRNGFKTLFARNDGIRRELVKGSLDVYPIKGYGAIELGAHRFCHVEQGREDCGTFRFLHIWQKNGQTWKVTRVVSYGH